MIVSSNKSSGSHSRSAITGFGHQSKVIIPVYYSHKFHFLLGQAKLIIKLLFQTFEKNDTGRQLLFHCSRKAMIKFYLILQKCNNQYLKSVQAEMGI